MKWFGITGSWRITSPQVEHDVRTTVEEILAAGSGIVTGGALNVDYFATDEALKLNPTATHIHVFLPTTLEIYFQHYRKRAEEGVITKAQAELLINQLTTLKTINPTAITEHEREKEVTQETYYKRNQKVIDASDELYAFQVNGSRGVTDTIEKAEEKGIPIKLFSYTLSHDK